MSTGEQNIIFRVRGILTTRRCLNNQLFTSFLELVVDERVVADVLVVQVRFVVNQLPYSNQYPPVQVEADIR